MRGLLISGGNEINKEILYRESQNSYIICADCGIKNFYNTDIMPDLVVGDLDSIDNKGLEFIEKNNIKVERFPARKDLTDTELALLYLIEKDIRDIIILSATGTRMDHTMANIFLLEDLYNKDIKAKIIDNYNEIIISGKGDLKLFKDNYKYISIISLSDEVIYSTNGMEYETDHLKIKRFSARGVSNEIKKDFAEIIIHNGKAIIIKSKD